MKPLSRKGDSLLQERLKKLSNPSDIAATLQAYLESERHNHVMSAAMSGADIAQIGSALPGGNVICLDKMRVV
jgi:hypothetical protein